MNLSASGLPTTTDKNPVIRRVNGLVLPKTPRMVRVFSFFAILMLTLPAFAQQKVNLEGEIMLFSRHLWRGDQMGNAAAIEPSVTISSGIFSLNLWAAKTFNSSYAEVDLIPSIKLGSLSIILFDYYNPVRGEENRYFDFSKNNNRHSVELAVSHAASHKMPLRWMIGTFLFGDHNASSGNPHFSTYAEVGAPFQINTLDIDPFIGFTTHEGYYADRFSLVNCGSTIKRVFAFYNILLPVQVTATYNPNKNKAFVNFGAGIAF